MNDTLLEVESFFNELMMKKTEGGRVYDPLLGHFLSEDPVVGDAADGAMWNRYAYAVNNPATLIDPTGLQAKGPVITISKRYSPPEPAPSDTPTPITPAPAPPSDTSGPYQGPYLPPPDMNGSAKPAPSADDKGSSQVATPAQLAESKYGSGAGTSVHGSHPVIDVFVFGAISADAPPIPDPVRSPLGSGSGDRSSMIVNEFETIGVLGYSSEKGGYIAEIFARGLKVGKGSNYGAIFGGTEIVTTIAGIGDPEKTVNENIIVAEGGVGVTGTPVGVFAGSFETGPDPSGKYETGLFFGVGDKGWLNEKGFIGFGFVVPDLGVMKALQKLRMPDLGDVLRGLGLYNRGLDPVSHTPRW